jgi:hypothetical protein
MIRDILSMLLPRALFGLRIIGGGGSDAPDTSGVQEQARENAKLGRESFEWFKKEYADTEDERKAATDRSNAISDASLAGMQYAMEQAKDAEAYNKGTFRPLEQRLVADAQNYDTEARRSQEAGAAVAEVNRQVGAQRLATSQELARAGVSPESGKAQALASMQDIGAAKLAAGADYTARKNVEQQGHARMADAAALGRNLATTQATQQQISASAGGVSSQSGQQALGAATSGAGLVQTGFNTALAGSQSAGNLFGQAADLSRSGGNDLSGMGNLIGGLASAYKVFSSSKKLKTDLQPVSMSEALGAGGDEPKRAASGGGALDAVKDLDVYSWRYKPGEGDGGEHVGPTAEDAQAALGDDVAPGGKVINVDAMRGVTGKAQQQLLGQFMRVQKKLQLLMEQGGE